MRVDGSFYTVPGMRVDGKVLAVNGKSNFDGTFTAATQHDGKFLAVDGFPFFDGNFLAVDGDSNLTVSRPYTGTVHQFGTFMSENLPNTSLFFFRSLSIYTHARNNLM